MLPRGGCTRLFEADPALIPKENKSARLNVPVSNRREKNKRKSLKFSPLEKTDCWASEYFMLLSLRASLDFIHFTFLFELARKFRHFHFLHLPYIYEGRPPFLLFIRYSSSTVARATWGKVKAVQEISHHPFFQLHKFHDHFAVEWFNVRFDSKSKFHTQPSTSWYVFSNTALTPSFSFNDSGILSLLN